MISYHPQANGQTGKTNAIFYKIITETIQNFMIDRDSKLLDAYWD